jgi:hypothetical protein
VGLNECLNLGSLTKPGEGLARLVGYEPVVRGGVRTSVQCSAVLSAESSFSRTLPTFEGFVFFLYSFFFSIIFRDFFISAIARGISTGDQRNRASVGQLT